MGVFFVISGPSAVGKTTLVESLLMRLPDAVRITTLTTRPPREGEREGKDFFFISRNEFEAMRDRGELIEWSEHFSNYYGTSREHLYELLKKHSVVFGILDINGARQVREREPRARGIFIKPGSTKELERRMQTRVNIHGEAERRERLDRAERELKAAPGYHHTVVNRDGAFDETVQAIYRLIMREQSA